MNVVESYCLLLLFNSRWIFMSVDDCLLSRPYQGFYNYLYHTLTELCCTILQLFITSITVTVLTQGHIGCGAVLHIVTTFCLAYVRWHLFEKDWYRKRHWKFREIKSGIDNFAKKTRKVEKLGNARHLISYPLQAIPEHEGCLLYTSPSPRD